MAWVWNRHTCSGAAEADYGEEPVGGSRSSDGQKRAVEVGPAPDRLRRRSPCGLFYGIRARAD